VLESLVALRTSLLGANGQADTELLDATESLGRLRARDLKKMSGADREANRQFWLEIASRSHGQGQAGAGAVTDGGVRAGRALVMAAKFSSEADRVGLYDEALGLLRSGDAPPQEVASVLVAKADHVGEHAVTRKRELLLEAWGVLRQARDTTQYVDCAKALAEVLVRDAKLLSAKTLLQEALETERRQLGNGDPRVVQAKLRLAQLMVVLGPDERVEAGGLLEEVQHGETGRAGANTKALREVEQLLERVKGPKDKRLRKVFEAENEPAAELLLISQDLTQIGPAGLIVLSKTVGDQNIFARVGGICLCGPELREGVLPLVDALAQPEGTAMLRSIILWDVALGTEEARGVAAVLSRPESQPLQQRLTSFQVRHCLSLGDEGAAALIHALKRYPQLTDLEISNCGATVEGVRTLDAVLQEPGTLPSVRDINVSGNPLGDDGVTALARALGLWRVQGRPGPWGLHLQDTQMTPTGLGAVVQTISANPGLFERLATLDVFQNRVGGDALTRLAQILPQLPGLASVRWLGGMQVGPGAVVALAAAAKEPGALPQVQKVHLGEWVGDVGVQALAEALRLPDTLPQLKSLILCDVMTDAGAKALAEAIEAPGALQSLTELHLGGNDEMGEAGVVAIVDSLRAAGACPCLRRLYLDYGSSRAEKIGRAFYGPQYSDQNGGHSLRLERAGVEECTIVVQLRMPHEWQGITRESPYVGKMTSLA
jgi:hypothetical protein